MSPRAIVEWVVAIVFIALVVFDIATREEYQWLPWVLIGCALVYALTTRVILPRDRR